MIYRRHLAEAAMLEVAAREKHWPREVAAGRMTAPEAEADSAAWRIVAALLDDGRVGTTLAWADIIFVVRSAVERQLDRFASADPSLRALLDQRINALTAILRALEDSARAGGFATFVRKAA